jgi:hypothetical protein
MALSNTRAVPADGDRPFGREKMGRVGDRAATCNRVGERAVAQ